MLTEENIEEAALYISSTKEEWFELMYFFNGLKPCKLVTDCCYPVILIVDEVSAFLLFSIISKFYLIIRLDKRVSNS